jgi:glycosyltransferase involved in cell wall biosynthesis
MTDLPLVSIVTPSYNQGNFLESTIQSVLKQTYPHIEYLVIDGGSTDDSISIIQRYSDKIKYWESQPDRGQAHAVNKGLLKSHGDILGWLNSDDVLLPQTVALVVDVFRKEPEVDVVYGRLDRIDEKGKILPTPILPKDRVDFSKELVVGECVVNQPGCFWKREVMQRVGLLNENLDYALDYEYWARLALEGAIFFHLPNVLALFRLSPMSKTVGQTTKHAIEQLYVLDEISSRQDLPEKIGKSPDEIKFTARTTRARFYLQAFYGEYKNRNLVGSISMLGKAMKNDPRAIFDRRWIELGFASLKRRLMS